MKGKKIVSTIGNIYFSIITDVAKWVLLIIIQIQSFLRFKKRRKKERYILYSIIIESDGEHKEIANIWRKFIYEFIFAFFNSQNANTKNK